MHFTPQAAGVPLDCSLRIAMDQQEAGPANPNQDTDGLPLQNIKQSPPRVQVAGPKRDILTPEIQPNLNEVEPEIERQ
uniref:Uncharacterized protein n=1 Tax=Romanomermis culicivorax TaxID=13658 RepID=A0A915IXI4_ROMCU